MSVLAKFLQQNKSFSNGLLSNQPDLLQQCKKGQWPQVLWIGCSDSRCSESNLLQSNLGDVFVHRNIANQFHNDDASANAVVDYAVDSLKVKHIVLVGHTGCGGVGAVDKLLNNEDIGLSESSPIVKWLSPFLNHVKGLNRNVNQQDLIKENVFFNLANLKNSVTVKNALDQGRISVHGWLYNIETGLIDEID